ncbi:hypothetical protein OS493_028143 [Desmophyllum pertusum]|uniref:Uncharacterized protein n=1 Tax=Desmophyllum pertusum TaxID=174260 RepID=A0A9W9ZAT7_9CNID|nr:hypothetical protein OS493_028143 [Desmophyllum pertusum]
MEKENKRRKENWRGNKKDETKSFSTTMPTQVRIMKENELKEQIKDNTKEIWELMFKKGDAILAEKGCGRRLYSKELKEVSDEIEKQEAEYDRLESETPLTDLQRELDKLQEEKKENKESKELVKQALKNTLERKMEASTAKELQVLENAAVQAKNERKRREAEAYRLEADEIITNQTNELEDLKKKLEDLKAENNEELNEAGPSSRGAPEESR